MRPRRILTFDRGCFSKLFFETCIGFDLVLKDGQFVKEFEMRENDVYLILLKPQK